VKDLLAFIRKNPVVAIATAAVAGLALGTGVIPLSLPRLGAMQAVPSTKAAPAAPPPPPDAIDAY
jgi:hypothetical protein